MGISARALLREKGTPYAELGLADPKWSDDELIDFMLAHPILINRPIVVTPKGTKLCRPSEAVLELLDHPATSFVKEDGEVVARGNLSRRHCEERSDEAIQLSSFPRRKAGLLRFARNDGCGMPEAWNSRPACA